MKFSTEKKNTLCIYTETEYGSEKMECEVRALRKELEETRQALRLQTVRCRQLVAAFTSKLQEKEREVAAGRTLRDQQLSRVLRALIVLEARLRREQRVIRQQLAERDTVIQAQQQELDTLRKLQEEKKVAEEDSPKEEEPEVVEETKEEPKPEPVVEAPASSSTEEEEQPSATARPFRPTSQSTAFVRFRKNSRSRIHTQQGSYRPVTRRKAAAAALAHQDHGGVDDEELGTRDLYKDYQHNPVLECVNQILLRDHDEMMEKPEKRFSYHCPSIQEEQENSTEEEETTPAQQEPSKDKEETPAQQPEVWPTKDKTPSPPIKAQLLEEKACLLMASQRLTLVRNPEFEEVDKENEPVKSPPPPLPPPHAKNLTPPALPPKPTQLGGKGYHPLLFPRKMNGTNHHHHHVNGNTYPGRGVKPELKTVKQTEVHHHGHTHNVDKQQTPSPSRQRQILSNGSLKVALAHDVVQENGRGPLFDHHHHHNHHNHHYNHNHQEKNNNNSFEENLDNLTDVTNTRHRKVDDGRASTKTMKSGSEQQGGNTALNKSPGHCGKIRVGSSVSSLITGSCGNSIVSELTKGESEAKLALPRVSQIVRRFEDLSTEKDRASPPVTKDEEEEGDDDTLRHNFEEFRLEDVDMDEEEDRGRPAGDGAESRSTVVIQNGTAPSTAVNGVAPGTGGSYEHFLEATGLSQKSILTPSRMLSNHRSVLKPKDVKHRSKVLKAAAGVTTGPVVKYWIEPFL